jgi:uncharacterized protein YbjT (DUF2867 family)
VLHGSLAAAAWAHTQPSGLRTQPLPTPPQTKRPGSLGRLQYVEFDLEDPDTFAAALGPAGKVICTVGASEAGLDPSAPKRIDGDGTIALIEAAAAAGVGQFVLVSSIGTGKFGLPSGVLNLFFGVLLWKKRAEEALEASGMSYTIIRPGEFGGRCMLHGAVGRLHLDASCCRWWLHGALRPAA